ncbi:hypothetical protein NEPAR04_2203 [Nematocida parisii]|nr:hypothetical protein NEPAR08_1503 [Nematocida parisii]KAI5129545.1 hypothetical protein NEPAR03_1708 [Nematocida parisii]KAI5144707.1 hypothetical protein NEPAR04_2203 [Nematocida parisii]
MLIMGDINRVKVYSLSELEKKEKVEVFLSNEFDIFNISGVDSRDKSFYKSCIKEVKNKNSTEYSSKCTLSNHKYTEYNNKCTLSNHKCTEYSSKCTLSNHKYTEYNSKCTLSNHKCTCPIQIFKQIRYITAKDVTVYRNGKCTLDTAQIGYIIPRNSAFGRDYSDILLLIRQIIRSKKEFISLPFEFFTTWIGLNIGIVIILYIERYII